MKDKIDKAFKQTPKKTSARLTNPSSPTTPNQKHVVKQTLLTPKPKKVTNPATKKMQQLPTPTKSCQKAKARKPSVDDESKKNENDKCGEDK